MKVELFKKAYCLAESLDTCDNANYILDKKGIVVGAAFDDNNHLKHIAVEKKKDLEPLRKSKYLQSDLGNVFKYIKEQVKTRKVLFVGTPGTGKTHLSTSIGIEAARNSKSTYFITCKDLLWQLNKAAKENTLERRLKHFYSYSLLIIDELGHDVINAEDANHLFQLLQMRYEKHSTIITTNYNIKDWNKIFPDSYNELDAMLDRFLHHVQIVTINGKSYRRKDLSQYWSD